MPKCVICDDVFDRGKNLDERIQCQICKKQAHSVCAKIMSVEVLKLLQTNPNIWWICENCEPIGDLVSDKFASFMSDVTKKLNSIEKKVSGNSEKLAKHDEKLDSIQKSTDLRINVNQNTTYTRKLYKKTLC